MHSWVGKARLLGRNPGSAAYDKLCDLRTTWPGFLCLGLLFCKMGMTGTPTSEDSVSGPGRGIALLCDSG